MFHDSAVSQFFSRRYVSHISAKNTNYSRKTIEENMNSFRLIIYQLLILFVSHRLGRCEEFDYDLKLEQVSIDDMEGGSWQSIYLSKYKSSDSFILKNDESDQTGTARFTSSNVEILELCDRKMRFSLIYETVQWFVNVTFSEQSSVQQFFRDVRSQQKKPEQYGLEVPIAKFFQYNASATENNEQPLKLLAHEVSLYEKYLNEKWFANPKSFTVESDKVYLVFLSKTFNISPISNNKYVLCLSENITTRRFILCFPGSINATAFYDLVKDDLKREIPCASNWVSPTLARKLSARHRPPPNPQQ